MDGDARVSHHNTWSAAGAASHYRRSRTGLALAERYGLSIYDAMIAASALHADCDTLWSEDLHDGIVLDGRLRIANPFRAS